jgi:hypothetical protein
MLALFIDSDAVGWSHSGVFRELRWCRGITESVRFYVRVDDVDNILINSRKKTDENS